MINHNVLKNKFKQDDMNKELKKKIEKSKNLTNTGLFRVSKKKDTRYEKGFVWQYSIREKNGVNKWIYAPNLTKLQYKVLRQGFPWIVVDESKAKVTLNIDERR